jgi:5-(carboxyamino)imidazole ribonucleotide mutase
MPRGVPVGTVAIDGAMNAALLACAILALKHEEVAQALDAFRERMAEG